MVGREGGRTQWRDERNEEQTGEGKRKKEKREGEERSIGEGRYKGGEKARNFFFEVGWKM